jgi:hypothetical protein
MARVEIIMHGNFNETIFIGGGGGRNIRTKQYTMNDNISFLWTLSNVQFLTKHNVSTYKGFTRVGFFLPEDRNKAQLRNTVLHQKLDDVQSEKKERNLYHVSYTVIRG